MRSKKMRKLKWLKPLISVALSAALAFPAMIAHAQEAETLGARQKETIHAEESRVIDGAGFWIEEGVLTHYSGDEEDVTIPEGVTSIGESAFYMRRDLIRSVNLPKGVTSIGESAFFGCTNLSSINLSEGLSSIGDSAFWGCSSLSSISFSEGLSSIGDSAFRYLENLSSIELPEGLSSIGGYAFSGCENLSSIELPEGLSSIGAGIFSHCDSLSSIELPEGLSSIGIFAFSECTSLRNIVLPKELTCIEQFVFSGCSSLGSIILPEGLSSLSSINFPESLTSVGNFAFSGCNKLVIYGKPGSYAETYAKENNIQFSSDPMPLPEKKEISACQVRLGKVSYTYDGKPKMLAVVITDGGKVLAQGTDYQVRYEANTNAGTARVIITGLGDYQGEAAASFAIKKASQSISAVKSYEKAYGDTAFLIGARMRRGDGKLTYSSSDKKVAAVNKGGKVTVKGTGIATVMVKASATANYNAASLKVTIKAKPARQALKSVSPIKGRRLSISWGKGSRASGYQVQYAMDKNFKKGAKTITVKKGKTTSQQTPKLKAGNRYYVRVRSYKSVKLGGKSQRLNGAWSKAKKSGKVK